MRLCDQIVDCSSAGGAAEYSLEFGTIRGNAPRSSASLQDRWMRRLSWLPRSPRACSAESSRRVVLPSGLDRSAMLPTWRARGETAAGKEAGGQPGSQVAILRRLPAAQIARIEDSLIASQFKGYDPNASIVDGWVLPQSPASAFASGKIQQVDLLWWPNGRSSAPSANTQRRGEEVALKPARSCTGD